MLETVCSAYGTWLCGCNRSWWEVRFKARKVTEESLCFQFSQDGGFSRDEKYHKMQWCIWRFSVLRFLEHTKTSKRCYQTAVWIIGWQSLNNSPHNLEGWLRWNRKGLSKAKLSVPGRYWQMSGVIEDWGSMKGAARRVGRELSRCRTLSSPDTPWGVSILAQLTRVIGKDALFEKKKNCRQSLLIVICEIVMEKD